MIRPAEAVSQQPDLLDAGGSNNLYRVLWQRKSLLILALVIAMVLGSLYYANTPPVYKSEAKLLVIRKTPAGLSDNTATNFVEDYLTTHTTLLLSPLIISNAVASKDLKNYSMFAGMQPQEIVAAVAAGLTVSRDIDSRDPNGVRGSSILTISFRGGEPLETMRVVEAIISAYKEYLDTKYLDTSQKVVNILNENSKIYNDNILKTQQDVEQLMRKKPFLDVVGGDVGRTRAAKRMALEAKISDADLRAKDLRIRLDTIEGAIQNKNTGAAMLLLAMEYTRVYGDRTSNAFAAALTDRIFDLELQKMLLEGEVGPNHPSRKALETRLKAMKEYGEKQTDAVKNDEQASAGTKDNALQNSINAQKLELATLERQRDFWKEQLELLKVEAQADAGDEIKYRSLAQNLELLNDQYKATTAKLRDFAMTKEQGGMTAEVIFPPGQGVKVEPRLMVVIFISTFLGLLAGVGLAYLADITDKSFRSPEEIRRRLNLPVLGHIPSLLSEEEEKAKIDGVAGPDPILVTYYKSKSRKAEVFRAVRTALYFNTRGEGHKVIQITSPNMGDGKTTLSTNLSVSVAQSGKRIILIDADFRRPRIHKIFGVGNDVGFTSVLTGQCELREAIQPSAIPGLSLLSSGPIPPNPAELLTSPRFKELIDELREQFDFVIVDTPPLLVVTDPCVVAPRVDGVLLCIRVAKNGRPVAERAREVLASLGANVLGVVVNGVSLFGQNYGYGYSYGYQYGQYDYGSQYQYKYEYYDRYYGPYDDYYNDRDEDGIPRRAAPATPAVAAPAPAPEASGESAPPNGNQGGGWLNRMFGKK